MSAASMLLLPQRPQPLLGVRNIQEGIRACPLPSSPGDFKNPVILISHCWSFFFLLNRRFLNALSLLGTTNKSLGLLELLFVHYPVHWSILQLTLITSLTHTNTFHLRLPGRSREVNMLSHKWIEFSWDIYYFKNSIYLLQNTKWFKER